MMAPQAYQDKVDPLVTHYRYTTDVPRVVEHEWGVGDSEMAFGEPDIFFDGDALPVELLGKTVETPLGPGVYLLDRSGQPRVRFNLGCETDGCLRYLTLYLGYNGSAFSFDGTPVVDLRNFGFVCEVHAEAREVP